MTPAAQADARPPARRVAVNTSLRAGGEVIVKLVSLGLWAAIARELGRDDLGRWAFALAVVSVIWTVSGFGLDRMALRDIARDPDAVDRVFWPLAGLKFALGAVCLSIALAGMWLGGYDGTTIALVAVIGAQNLLGHFTTSAVIVFQAHEAMQYWFWVKVPIGLLGAALGIVTVLAGGGIVLVGFMNQVIAEIVALTIALAILARRFRRPPFRLQLATWRDHLRVGAPFGFQEGIGQIIFRFDTIALSFLTTTAVVGSYGAAFRLVEATLFLVWSLGTSVLPMYSYLEPGGRPSLASVFEGSVKLVLALLLPISTALVILAPAVVDAIYGLPRYAATVPVLRILAFSVACYGVGHLAGILLLVRRPGRITVRLTAAVAAFNVIGCIALIPPLGARGAAIATLSTQAVLALSAFVLCRGAVRLPSPPRLTLGPLVAAAVMAVALWPLRHHLVLAVPAGAVVYLATVALVEARVFGLRPSTLRDALAARDTAAAREGQAPAAAGASTELEPV
jgi:O-antigen/teichoic acid export membrane protein